MIDLSIEPPITLAEAVDVLPKPGGRGTHFSTILRWILKGHRGVKLEALRLGGRWVTSRAALQRFAERLTPNLDDNTTQPVTRSSSRRQRAAEQAERELAAAGI